DPEVGSEKIGAHVVGYVCDGRLFRWIHLFFFFKQKTAYEMCKPVLLEPIMTMNVVVPDECMGDVIGDLNSRRGKVLGVEPKGNGQQVIKAYVPMAEVLRYAPDLRSMTSGRGDFALEFSHYEEVPPHIAEKLIKEAQATRAERHG